MSKKLNKINTKVNFDKLIFDNKNLLGKGSFGKVYRAYNGTHKNNRLAAKKTESSLSLQLFSLFTTGHTQTHMFKKEIEALEKLSKIGISPKIYYYDIKNKVYVIEKLDYTLFEMLKNKEFNPYHLKKLTSLFKKYKQSPYKHLDLHEANIMYSEKKKRFYIIDWGLFTDDTKCILNKKKTKKAKKANCFKLDNQNKEYLDILFKYLNKKVKQKPELWIKDYTLFLKEFN